MTRSCLCACLGASTDEERLATSLSTALSAASETAVVVPFGDDLIVNVGGRSFRQLTANESLGWSDSRVALEVAIEQEEGMAQDDLLPEGVRLMQRLAGLGLRIEKQAGDGNCQFRSLARALYGTAERHMRVRRRACAYIAGKGRRRFHAYLGPALDEYVARMRCDGTWGDELTLRAIAEEFSVVVSVITSSTSNFYLRYVPDRPRRSNAEVFLAYLSPCHYDRIVRGNGT